MLHATNEELLEVVRELARPTTPHELELRGIRHVRSIGLNEISLLIEKSVNRTLMKRTIGALREPELDELVGAAEAEFGAQLAELEELADSHAFIERQRAKVREDLDSVRSAIAQRERSDLRGLAEQAEADLARERDLRLAIQALLLPLRDGGTQRPGVRRVAEQLLALIDRNEERALAAQRCAHDDDVQLLERRVAKLIASLENAEQALAELAKRKDVEHGIASIYRTVQGLAHSELDREKKLEALERLFRSNLNLRSLVTRG